MIKTGTKYSLMTNKLQIQYAKYAIKGALVALLSLLAAKILGIERGYWVLFGAVTVLKINVGASVRRGQERLLGTIAGVVASLIFASLFMHWHTGFYFLLPLFLFCAVYYFEHYFIAMFFITLVFIFSIAVNSGNVMSFGLARIADTALGVLIAYIVSLYIWQESVGTALRLRFSEYLLKTRELAEMFGDSFIHQGLDIEVKRQSLHALDQLYLDLQSDLDLFRYEPGEKKMNRVHQGELLLILDRLRGIIALLGYLALIRNDDQMLPETVLQQLTAISHRAIQVLSELIMGFESYYLESATELEQEIADIHKKIHMTIIEVKNEVSQHVCAKEVIVTVSTYLQAMHDFIAELQLLIALPLWTKRAN